jgi:UDP-MurNAc hydroxylase
VDAELEAGELATMEIGSQALHSAFLVPFGVQTLGISARFKLNNNFVWWRAYRILFAFNNAEIYLKLRHLRSPELRE